MPQVLLSSQQLAELIKCYRLGESLAELFVIEENRLWKLVTNSGQFALKRLRSGALEEPQNPHQGEHIARIFARHRLPVITSLTTLDGQLVCQSGSVDFMVFPWINTQTVTSASITIPQARQVGQLVAQLHLLNIQLEQITLAAWQDFAEPDWSLYLNSFPTHQTECLINLLNYLPELESWCQQYKNARAKLSGDLHVISHGDITEGNLIWDVQDFPWLIDWETAGWIHPQVELLGVAINWAGITAGEINQDIYKAVIEGYCQQGGQVRIDQNVLAAGLGSWLAWLAYNLKLLSFDRDNRLAANQVIETLSALQRLIKSWPLLIRV